MQARQDRANRAISTTELHGQMVAGAPVVCHGIHAAMKLGQGSGHGWIQQESYASNMRQIHPGTRLPRRRVIELAWFPSI
jgi:hypothetical protein